MGTAEPAHNPHRTFSSYGGRMTERLVSLVVAFLLFSNPIHAQHRREAILRLRDDISTASACERRGKTNSNA